MSTKYRLVSGGVAVLLGAAATVGGGSAAVADGNGVPALSQRIGGLGAAADISDDGGTVAYLQYPTSNRMTLKAWDRATGRTRTIYSITPGDTLIGDPQVSGDGQDVYWMHDLESLHPVLRHWNRATNRTTQVAMPVGTASAVVSRDESTLIYNVFVDSTNKYAVYQRALATGRERNIAYAPDLSLSAVSRTGAFVTWTTPVNEGNRLVRYSTETKATTTIARNANDSWSAISEDGSVVMFKRTNTAGFLELSRWVRSEGVRPYSTLAVDPGDPSMSDDGLATAASYTPRGSESSGIAVVTGARPVITRVDGGSLRRGVSATGPGVSGDGEYVAYVRQSADPATSGIYVWGPNPRH